MYDISMTIKKDMLVYKGRDNLRPEIIAFRNFDNSDVHQSKLIMNLHTGTHVDAPLHMLENGDSSNCLFDEKPFYKSHILNLTSANEKITAKDLKKHEIKPDSFILLKTQNSKPFYLQNNPKKFIYLDETGAEYLINQKVKGVGIDSIGIERNQDNYPTHKKLLKNNILILEGIKLNKTPEGEFILFLALFKISGSDGVPARAYVLKKDEINRYFK